MGRQWIEGFLEMGVDADIALGYHLKANHYPPVSGDFIPACKKAIEAGNNGEQDKEIEMCNGKILTASRIIEGLHLDSFLEYDEEW